MNDFIRRFKAWGELLRLPNLFTLPGDVLAGGFAGAPGAGVPALRIAAVIVVSVLLYGAGLILNDILDLETDRMERPGRPLPSERLGVGTALAVAVLFMLAALAAAWWCGAATFRVAAMLSTLIVAYNAAAKRKRITGAVAMGACRGLNVMLGASVTGAPLSGGATLFPVLVIAGVIAVITWIAAGEMSGQPVGGIRRLPAAGGAIGAAVFLQAGLWAAAAVALAAAADHAWTGMEAGKAGADVPRQVGRWIRGMIVLQAAFCAAAACPAGDVAAGALLAMRPLSALAGRRFHGS